jgi:hypothetical protein
MAKRVPKKISIDNFIEIAKQFHEEYPLYECKNCFRETMHGSETVKYGEICSSVENYICIYCNNPLTKLTF